MGGLFFGDPLEIRTPDPLLKRRYFERKTVKMLRNSNEIEEKRRLLRKNNSY